MHLILTNDDLNHGGLDRIGRGYLPVVPDDFKLPMQTIYHAQTIIFYSDGRLIWLKNRHTGYGTAIEIPVTAKLVLGHLWSRIFG